MGDPHARTDPYAHALQKPPNGDEYEDRDYDGLYVFRLKDRSYIAKMRWIREGMGREFHDPITNEYLGFCGSFVAAREVVSIADLAVDQCVKDGRVILRCQSLTDSSTSANNL